jgi:hypothetical protein
MNKKPEFAELVDWIEGRLAPHLAEKVGALVAADAGLQETADWIRSFFQTRTETIWAAPPAETRDNLRRRFAAHTAENRPRGLLKRLTAALTFDSQTQFAAGGTRSAADMTERQVVYSTSYIDVALTLQSPPRSDTFKMFGQILPTSTEAGSDHSVQLFQIGVERAFMVAAEVGEFVFEEILVGEYELVVSSDRYEILIPFRFA